MKTWTRYGSINCFKSVIFLFMLGLPVLFCCAPEMESQEAEKKSLHADKEKGQKKPLEKEIKISSTVALGEFFDSIGYNVSKNPDILNAIPRIRFTHVPKNWEKQPSIPLKKSLFFRSGGSGILQVNEQLLKDRNRLTSLKPDSLSKKDQEWLAQTMSKYQVTENADTYTAEQLAELTRRVDIIPPSMALVQSAIESGWGDSRFAREGNALFGQWTTGSSGIKAKGSEARLAVFTTPRDSIVAYCMNLNTHRTYAGFRNARAEMRKSGKPLDGIELAGHLGSYSEKGDEYIRLVRDMIKKEQIQIADRAKLADRPEYLIRPIDGKL